MGKESLRITEASLLEATGGVLLSDEARQLLVMGVSVSTIRLHGNVPEYVLFLPHYSQFPRTFSVVTPSIDVSGSSRLSTVP